MAHEISSILRKDGDFFSTARELPWHGLGTIVEKCPTSEEAIILAGLNYTVEKTPVQAVIGEDIIPLPNKFITYREDVETLFDIVSDRYTIIQNKEAFSFFDTVVGEGAAVYETAGSLFGGKTIFISALLPMEFTIGKDQVDTYLLLVNSHDGKGAIRLITTPIRVVCNNTLRMALGQENAAIRHSSSARDKIRMSFKAIETAKTYFKKVKETGEEMQKITVNDEWVDLFSYLLFLDAEDLADTMKNGIKVLSTRTKNKLKLFKKYFKTGVGQKDYTTVAWGAFNAYTGFIQNVAAYNNADLHFEKYMELDLNRILGYCLNPKSVYTEIEKIIHSVK